MPGTDPAIVAAVATSASPSRPGIGRIWIVTSRATLDCHWPAAAPISTTAPTVSEARNVMMAITATSARPAMESTGTIEVSPRGAGARARRFSGVLSSTSKGLASFIIVQPSFVQHQAARIELVHQRDVVRGDDDGGSRLVEFDEEAQQAFGQRRIDIAGRLVGEQQLRPADDGARDRGTLLLAARQDRRQRPHAVAEPDPVQQLGNLVAVAVLAAAQNAQRQSHVLERRHVVEQAEILEDDADAAAQGGQRVLAQAADVMTEQADEAAAGLERDE